MTQPQTGATEEVAVDLELALAVTRELMGALATGLDDAAVGAVMRGLLEGDPRGPALQELLLRYFCHRMAARMIAAQEAVGGSKEGLEFALGKLGAGLSRPGEIQLHEIIDIFQSCGVTPADVVLVPSILVRTALLSALDAPVVEEVGGS